MTDWKTPNARLVLPASQEHSERWHEIRQSGFTGTDAAALMGVNNYATPRDVFLAKTGRLEEAEPDNRGVLEFGNRMEPTLTALFEDETGVKTRNVGTLRNTEHEFLLANPDRLTGDGGILEIKTTAHNGETAEQWRGNEVPGHAYIQLQHYLLVTGRKHGWFVVGFRNNFINYNELTDRDWGNTWFVSHALRDTKVVGPIEANPDVQADILRKIHAMRAAINADDTALIEWPDDFDPDKRWITTTPDTSTVARFGTETFVQHWHDLKAEEKQIKTKLAKLERNFKAQLAGTETLTNNQGETLVTYKTTTSRRFDQAGFRAAHPDLYAEHQKQTISRRMTVKRMTK